MVLTQPQPPYAIAWASPGWLALSGYSSLAEIAGLTLSIVQGPRTQRAVVDRIVEAARYEQSVEGLRLVNYDTQGRPFRHTLRVTPVRSRSARDVLAYCASSSDVCPLHWGETTPPPSAELLEEEEFWGEEVEGYFARWAEVGAALMAQEGTRHH